jgi:sugar lactone lactonase YvrE
MPGGELIVECKGFVPDIASKVFFGDVEAPIVSASDKKIVLRLPESPSSLGIALSVKKKLSDVYPFNLATLVASELHPVANPVIAPDGAIITTISGERGQQISQPLIRVAKNGDKTPFHCDIMNPTGLAFSRDGQLYISSRGDGTVVRYADFESLEIIAEDLGIPCGIAFDSENILYVGDRTGRIYKVDSAGNKEEFVQLEPSISAYHLAFDSEDRLYVTGPTFSLRDSLIRISRTGNIESLVDNLARPQGMAFLPNGDLLVCASYQGKKGVFQYSPKEGSFEHRIAGPILVGLAATERDLYLTTNSAIYWMPLSTDASAC